MNPSISCRRHHVAYIRGCVVFMCRDMVRARLLEHVGMFYFVDNFAKSVNRMPRFELYDSTFKRKKTENEVNEAKDTNTTYTYMPYMYVSMYRIAHTSGCASSRLNKLYSIIFYTSCISVHGVRTQDDT